MKSNLTKIILIYSLFTFGLLKAQTANSWVQRANSGGGNREMAIAFSIGTKGYIGAGGGNQGYKDDFWEYDPTTDVWTQKANIGGGGRSGGVGFSIGNKGYVGTGMFATLPAYRNDFWEYDTTNNVWMQKSNFPGIGRTYAMGFAIGNKGYLGTGLNTSIVGTHDDFYEYNPLNDTWIQIANYGGGIRSLCEVFVIGNKAYVGLGENNTISNLIDFWEFNQTTGNWTQIANFGGVGRIGAASFAIGSSGYVGTGRSGNSSTIYSDFWEYNPISDTWTQKTNYGGGANGGGVGFSIGCKGYISSNTNANFWEYVPSIIGTSVSIIGNQLIAVQLGASYQWIDCNNSNSPILGATSQSYTPGSNGNYAVEVTLGGCVSTSTCSAFITTGIEKNNAISLNPINIYPNPNNGSFNIKTVSESNFKIINDLGQIVKEVQLNTKNNFNVTVDGLSNGIYMLVGLNNKQVVNQKIIITK